MSTLHDLRSTLDREAATVHDSAAAARVAAVRGRARAVRRRRTAGGAVAVALVVAGVSAVALLPDASTPVPADRVLGGFEAPPSLQSLGTTYSFEEGATGQDRVRITVQDSGAPTLVTWAAESGTARVEFRAEGTADRREAPAGFNDFTVLSPGGPDTVVVHGDGEVAVALYRYDVPAEGDTADGLTWRDQVGAATRLGSVHAEPGETDVTLEVPVAQDSGVLRFQDYCRGLDAGWTSVVEIDGEVSSVGECGQAGAERGGNPGDGSTTFPERARWGSSVSVRVYVVEGRFRGRTPEGGAPAATSAPGVRLGAAVYEEAAAATSIAGWDVPGVLEHGGHLWRYTGSVEGSGEGGPAELRLRSGANQVLVSAFSRWAGSNRLVRLLRNGRIEAQLGAGGASPGAVVGTGGDTVTLRDPRGAARLGLATYERVD